MNKKNKYDKKNLRYLKRIMPQKVNVFLRKKANPKDVILTKQEKEFYEDVCCCLKIMSKYKSKRWWLSSDLKKIAYYSLLEHVIINPFPQFQKGAEELLNHPIQHITFAFCWNELIEEAKSAYSGH